MATNTTKLPTVRDLNPAASHMKVIEIYNAFQGEGLRIGEPSVFVRLAGCTVGCAWCDTKFSWKAAQGVEYLPVELAEEIKKLAFSDNIVLTGGEPFEHPTHLVVDLLNILLANPRRHVTIETSGTGHDEFDPADMLGDLKNPHNELTFSISPKLPSAESNKLFPDLGRWLTTAAYLGANVQLKPVIMFDSDLEYFLEEMALDPILWSVPVIFQVGTPHTLKNIEEIRKDILDKMPRLMAKVSQEVDPVVLRNIRVLPQLHTLIFGQKRGV